MDFSIQHWIRINDRNVLRNDVKLVDTVTSPEALYRDLKFSYPKFFKMDILCKWAWIAAEILLKESDQFIYEGIDKNKVAVVLATSHGCLDVDKKYQQTILSIASPALFVYTLSNIMLGEICIRHGFKGEQACLVNDCLDSMELYFWVRDLLENRGMNACLCGWVDAVDNQQDVSMFWVVKNGKGITLSPDVMQQVYNS